MAAAGWYRDPTGFGEGRYWDGQRWTDQVISAGGVNGVGPINTGIDTPPAPGTEYRASAGAPAQPVTTVTQKSSSPVGAILGALALVIAVIAVVIALSGDSDDDEVEEEPTTTEAPAEPPEGDAPAEPPEGE